MTGDGELQEGQIWESLQPVANERLAEITVIVDHNKFQSDTAVAAVSDLGAARREVPRLRLGSAPRRRPRLRACCATRSRISRPSPTSRRCSSPTPSRARACRSWKASPAAIRPITSTPARRRSKNYVEGDARADRARQRAGSSALGQPPATLTSAPLPARIVAEATRRRSCSPTATSCSQMARHRPEIIVMDADLLSDCGIEAFKAELPERFIECGIAEQHMVSAAGGMALRGMLPVVHSFACFLSTRANEHIYNNATEKRRSSTPRRSPASCPAGPGHSHQSVRDISAIGAVPGLIAFEPCSEREARLAIRWAVEQNADEHLPAIRQRAARSAVHDAGRLRAAGRPRRDAAPGHRRRDHRLRHRCC